MLYAILTAFAEAFRNLRINFFQTFLSVLGIIIGVGALVTMLALIDGLEKMARDGISEKSTLHTVSVRQKTHKRVDGLRIRLEEVATIDLPLMDAMLASLPFPAEGQIYTSNTTMINRPDTTEQLAIRYTAISLPLADKSASVAFGRTLQITDEGNSQGVVTVNHLLARRLIGAERPVEDALGLDITIEGETMRIVGIEEQLEVEPFMHAVFPLYLLKGTASATPVTYTGLINFTHIEDVRPGKTFVEEWFGERFPEIEEPVETYANIDMVENMELGFTIFRLVMGFLIGIAVVVGGVGVMNVLLMSVTERTGEIGVRKAVGANRKRIITQFLSESVAISAIGSFLGLILGIGMALLSAVIISHFSDFEFTPVFSLQTLAVVSVLAVAIGILFGTYPARRAAGLDPVVAIQRT